MTLQLTSTVRGSGPGLLLAHGAASSVEDSFGTILDDLARRHTVVGPDYPGSGGTPRSADPLSLDALADGAVAAAADAGLERFAVLGYSMGTAVAVRAAVRHPERVTGLVLTAGLARPDLRLRLGAEIWRDLLDGDRALLAKYLLVVGSGAKHLNSLTEAQLATAIDYLIGYVPGGSADHLTLLTTIDTRADLARIAVPTLVVSPTGDELVDPALSRELAASIPGARLAEVDSGHDVGTEARDAWLAAIQNFLTEIGSEPWTSR
ncbi:alpha/beta fold hydrolase [Amycolatopsis anabasis]|uniref:alpha/beta fold hydrolase n=1 Tax=Amycolatopsis anabasis TaxID=1840409 RepID=UPI00131B6CEF|nr:alpha/beta fold hydrolase [Amycolatopsis anabasis]